MTNKNYQQIARQILDDNDFEPMQIQVAKKHLKRLEGLARALDVTVEEAATFAFYTYQNDLELAARIEESKFNN